jgi:hypothetical protein
MKYIIIFVFIIVTCLPLKTFAQCSDPNDSVCNYEEAIGTICVCIDNRPDPPVEFVDFIFLPNAGVELLNGRDDEGTLLRWRIWSPVKGSSGSLGIIKADAADDFDVKISPPGGGPGAYNITNIDLTPDNPENFSNITGGGNIQFIAGLTVQQSASGQGGEVQNLILGDTTGNITIPVLKSMTMIGGQKGGIIAITDRIDGPGWELTGQVLGNIITIADIVQGQVLMSNTALEFYGSLELLNGISSNGTVNIYLDMSFNTQIKLHHKNISGYLRLLGSNAGIIENGGVVTGEVVLASGIGNTFSGTATFDEVISASANDIPSSKIQVTNYADMNGTLHILGSMDGDIITYDICDNGLVWVAGDSIGDIIVNGNLDGDIIVDGNVFGNIDIHGNIATGSIRVNGDLIGSVNVDGYLGQSAHIAVNGNTAGMIDIGQYTERLSLIQVSGLDAGGAIRINSTQDNFSARGNIYIGTITSVQPVVFDGCIRIYDEVMTNDGGNLYGTIAIIGCHEAKDLNICIDGNNEGNIFVRQFGCNYSFNSVQYSCQKCP